MVDITNAALLGVTTTTDKSAFDSTLVWAAEYTRDAIIAALKDIDARKLSHLPDGKYKENNDLWGNVILSGNPYLYISGGCIVRLLVEYYRLSDPDQWSARPRNTLTDEFDIDFYPSPLAFTQEEINKHKKFMKFIEGESKQFADTYDLVQPVKLGPLQTKKLQFIFSGVMHSIGSVQDNVEQFDISAVKSFFYCNQLYLSTDTIEAVKTRTFTQIPGTDLKRVAKYAKILNS